MTIDLRMDIEMSKVITFLLPYNATTLANTLNTIAGFDFFKTGEEYKVGAGMRAFTEVKTGEVRPLKTEQERSVIDVIAFYLMAKTAFPRHSFEFVQYLTCKYALALAADELKVVDVITADELLTADSVETLTTLQGEAWRGHGMYCTREMVHRQPQEILSEVKKGQIEHLYKVVVCDNLIAFNHKLPVGHVESPLLQDDEDLQYTGATAFHSLGVATLRNPTEKEHCYAVGRFEGKEYALDLLGPRPIV